jgi:hypothetical protein
MTQHTYLRWRRGHPRTSRVFPPLTPDHSAYAEPCAVCHEPLGNGALVQLLAVGPEPDDREACIDGRWIAAVALLFHAECVGTAEPLSEM